MFRLPLAEVVEVSAEKGCGPWKAKAAETASSIRKQMASRAQRLGFTVYLLEENYVCPNKTVGELAAAIIFGGADLEHYHIRPVLRCDACCAGQTERRRPFGDAVFSFAGRVSLLLVYRDLDDLFLNRVRD
jgi:hypothetical protein